MFPISNSVNLVISFLFKNATPKHNRNNLQNFVEEANQVANPLQK